MPGFDCECDLYVMNDRNLFSKNSDFYKAFIWLGNSWNAVCTISNRAFGILDSFVFHRRQKTGF